MLLPHWNDPGVFASSTLMEEIMDITTLRSAYLCEQASPSEQVERFLAQCHDPDWAGLWIALVNADRLRQQALDVEKGLCRADVEWAARNPAPTQSRQGLCRADAEWAAT